jgi:hypothetical protein
MCGASLIGGGPRSSSDSLAKFNAPGFVARQPIGRQAGRSRRARLALSMPYEDQPALGSHIDPQRPDQVVHQTFCGT